MFENPHLQGVIVGALVGFIAALGLDEWRRLAARRERAGARAKLLGMLRDEVGTNRVIISEMFRGEADARSSELNEEERKRFWAGSGPSLAAIRENRKIYDAYLGSLIDLPEATLLHIVQYYNAVTIACDELSIAYRKYDAVKWQGVLTEIEMRTFDVLEELDGMLPSKPPQA